MRAGANENYKNERARRDLFSLEFASYLVIYELNRVGGKEIREKSVSANVDARLKDLEPQKIP